MVPVMPGGRVIDVSEEQSRKAEAPMEPVMSAGRVSDVSEEQSRKA